MLYCYTSTKELEAEGSEVQSYPQLHNKFQVNLDTWDPTSKIKTKPHLSIERWPIQLWATQMGLLAGFQFPLSIFKFCRKNVSSNQDGFLPRLHQKNWTLSVYLLQDFRSDASPWLVSQLSGLGVAPSHKFPCSHQCSYNRCDLYSF